jgi:hypothetical protein
MMSQARSLFSLIIFSGFLFFPTTFPANQTEGDLRFDLPAGGLVRIENRYGTISAEVWNNSYVSVAASLGAGPPGNSRLSRSPVVIDNKGKTLSIFVFVPVDSIRVQLTFE